eukprot:UN30121
MKTISMWLILINSTLLLVYKKMESNIIDPLDLLRKKNVESNNLNPNLDSLIKRERIFIAMPAFEERDCANTIKDAYEKAKHPERIFFGVYQQSDSKAIDCMEFNLTCPGHVLCERLWQIRIKRVKINEENSRGPTHARWMALQFLQDEEFIFVTDSHTRFRKDWDDIVITFWKSTKNPYAILTHYPKGVDNMDSNLQRLEDPNKSNPPAYMICGTYFEMPPNWMPRNANGCYVNKVTRPMLTPFWCAGFAFMPSGVEKKCTMGSQYVVYVLG